METADSNARTQRFSRRRFIVVGGTGLAATGLGTGIQPVLTAAAAAPTFTLDLVRREDMAVLTFEFHNLALSTGGPAPVLNRVDAQQPSLIVVRLGSQHLMEQPLFAETGQPEPSKPVGEIKSKAVGPSRIAFLVPQTVKSFPYSEDGLFDWWRWVMQVHGRALAPDERIPDPSTLPPVNTKPADLQTDLLLVDWLHLSPDRLATWQHPARPVTTDGRTELWHTTLRLRDDDGKPDNSAAVPTVRAVSFDEPLPGEEDFTVLRPPEQKFAPQQIVRATTDYELDLAQPEDLPVIKPVTADLVLLSSMGSSVELAGNWGPGHTELSIAKWLHRSTLGRDNYVRVESRGFCFPFGNRATLVSESERRVGEDGVARLFQRRFVVIREPVKTYPGYGDNEIQGRQFPFKEIRLTTTVSPDLPPPNLMGDQKISDKSFWMPTREPGTNDVIDFPFPVIATDWEGRTVQFSASVAYIDQAEAQASGGVLANFVGSYDNPLTLDEPENPTTIRRRVAMSGEKVAFAEQLEPGDTAYPVSELYLSAYLGDAETDELADRDLPNFYPAVLAANVRVPAVEALAGPGTTAFVGYDPAYTKLPAARAAAENQAQTFLRAQNSIRNIGTLMEHLRNPAVGPPTNGEIGVDFGGDTSNPKADKVGGVAIPNLKVGALSRTKGPLSGDVDGITKMAKGAFDPKNFFPSDATLLGDITLKDVVSQIAPGEQGDNTTTFITTIEYGSDGKPVAVVTTFAWKPRIFGPDEPDPTEPLPNVGPFIPYGEDRKHTTLELKGKFRTVFVGEKSSSEITGTLENFTLDLLIPNHAVLDFIAITFRRFSFEQHNDAKPKFEPAIAGVEFRGPLKFIQTLQKYLPVFEGLKVILEKNAVVISQDIPIPDVTLGVFQLTGLGFSAQLTLPFTGEPVSVEFAFASQENPFVVTVLCLGGGGYFMLELNVNRIIKVEGALVFGGELALNIVVASGKLSIMAGIYFKWEYVEKTDSEEITLRGYLRAVGQLKVLGLITISAEFMLALEYRSADNALEGIAKLKVTIEIAFFSKSVTLEVRKRFNGPSGDGARALAAAKHDFGDLISQTDWNTYIESFAG